MIRAFLRLAFVSLITVLVSSAASAEPTSRQIIAQAILTTDNTEKAALISSLIGIGDEDIKTHLVAWRQDALFIYEPVPDQLIPVLLLDDADSTGARTALRVDNGQPPEGAARLVPASLTRVKHTASLRRVMKTVMDVFDLASPDPLKRIQATQIIGFTQDLEKLPIFEKRLEMEDNPRARRTLIEAIAVTRLKSPDQASKLAALAELKKLHSLSSYDLVRTAMREAETAGDAQVAAAAKEVLVAIDNHKSTVNFFGTIFRGLSLGSVLLIVAIGLAITFGLMGVINMAHGEMIAVGAYTTYLVQNIFGTGITLPFFGLSLAIPGMNTSGAFYQTYFLFALPLSFLAAAAVGIGLERSIIRFLYRRPLESLLATWGVSLLLQQGLKLMFGSNNVQVSSPTYLSGNWTINDIVFGWNRVFVIGFAILIVFGVWLILTKTPLGLLIRSVMQNRSMASCMGVRTERVNMMTFGLGSGLAGLAGAFISQIGNVGPSLGQNYIVDCFMTVVVGGVGNLAGTVYSAVGIGLVDQSLQQILLNPVLGKILVLVAIILFLQWRPSGLFVTRSRNLDD